MYIRIVSDRSIPNIDVQQRFDGNSATIQSSWSYSAICGKKGVVSFIIYFEYE